MKIDKVAIEALNNVGIVRCKEVLTNFYNNKSQKINRKEGILLALFTEYHNSNFIDNESLMINSFINLIMFRSQSCCRQ